MNINNISALITDDGYSAGIMIKENSNYVGLLNHNDGRVIEKSIDYLNKLKYKGLEKILINLLDNDDEMFVSISIDYLIKLEK